ncbi:MAG: hypothetical protein WBH38_07600, partial [Defluviitoga tunisiensis]
AYYNDVLSMKKQEVLKKEQEFIEKFLGFLTPPNLPPEKALEIFKRENDISFVDEADFKKLEQWYKIKIEEWNKKLNEKLKEERQAELNGRTKDKTNEREKCYSGNFNKS